MMVLTALVWARWLNPAVWWRRRQRAVDLAILWPVCLREAESRASALYVFGVHMAACPAWTAAALWEFTGAERRFIEEVRTEIKRRDDGQGVA